MVASFAVPGVVSGLSSSIVFLLGVLATGAGWVERRRHRRHLAALHRGELALRKESLAYLLFNGSPRSMAPGELGRQISRLVAVRSSFGRAALMLRDDSGKLCVAGSAGFDDLSVEALNRWATTVAGRDLPLSEIIGGHPRVGTCSFTLALDRRGTERNPLSTMSCKEVHLVPLRTADGLAGALVVCAGLRPATHPAEPEDTVAALPLLSLADRLQPLEALALRLTMQLAAPENVTPIWPARERSRGERQGRGPRERQPRLVENTRRRNLDDAAPAQQLSTAAALERVRQILNPNAAPLPCIAGVSGRPRASTWRITPGAPITPVV